MNSFVEEFYKFESGLSHGAICKVGFIPRSFSAVGPSRPACVYPGPPAWQTTAGTATFSKVYYLIALQSRLIGKHQS
jgi:hypothetical protein